ncbi:G1/S-specific cyclin Pcl5 [Rhodotorula toruloides]|uniref:G1/S-specific cyclin Pcl5 n=1 Tax=Rhodotorula toruloides TaxID=5286 RepID=A0A511KB37_RHOTO|nr:G1/S-specific cyclin Pcl5 [Rhodotorula toruloides]
MSTLLPTPPPPHATFYPSAADEAAAYVAHASSLQQRSRSHSHVPLPEPKRPRSSAVPSALGDWTASRPPTSPVLKPCTASWTSSSHPLAPASTLASSVPPPLHAQALCPTPALTPPDDDEESHLEGRSGFVKRDDLTAKAVKRAQSLSTGAGEGGKDRLVNGLVGASVLAIESIWGPSTGTPCALSTPACPSSIIPLPYFVKEVLRRSRTSCSTLQLALYYLHKSRREIRVAVKRAGESEGEIRRLERELKMGEEGARMSGREGEEGAYPSPPRSPGHDLDAALTQSMGDRFTALVAAQNSPVLCGRRMFLAALICASKYLQDRNYSNRAWAKISGLDVCEINANERAFLKVVGFGLHLPAEEFQRWTERLAALNNSPSSSPTSSSASTVPSPLARSASEYHAVASTQLHLLAAQTRPSVPSSRKVLARGASAAVVYPSTASMHTATREKGFPIAAPRMAYRQPTPSSSSSSEGETEEHDSSSAYSFVSASASASNGRQVRALPTRRLRTTAAAGMVTASPASFVPQAWAAGVVPMEGVVVGQQAVEGVRAH